MKAILLLLLMLTACNGTQAISSNQDSSISATEGVWPTSGWKTSTLEKHGLSIAPLQELVRLIESDQYRDIHSVLIVKDGFLVFERYFNGYDKDRLQALQSVTKSVASTLIAVAMQQGKITDINRKVLDFFPEYSSVANVDDNKKRLALRHILMMQVGMDWPEESIPYSSPRNPLGQLNRNGGDWFKFVLDWPMEVTPGTRFNYNSGGACLLAGIIKNSTGMAADDFAVKHLFTPLGIKVHRWYKGGAGIPHLGGGLYLRPRDMAKIGYLYLKDGIWEGERILPENWVAEASKRHNPQPISEGNVNGYGYMWWIMRPPQERINGDHYQDIFMAWGYMGQFIFVVPEYDMVVVVTGGTSNRSDERKPLEFLYSSILKSATSVR